MIFLGAEKNVGIIWKIFSPLNPPKGDFDLFALNQGPLNPPKGDFDYVLLISHGLFYATKQKAKKTQEDYFYFLNENFPLRGTEGAHEFPKSLIPFHQSLS